MSYNQEQAKKYILDLLAKKNIKNEVHEFESGASMIDVWHDAKFYVVQLEIESIGLSLVDDKNLGFDTIPDERFFKFEEFIKKFNEVLS